MATAAKRRTEYRNYRRVGFDAYDGSAARQLEGSEVLQPVRRCGPGNAPLFVPVFRCGRRVRSPCLR